MATKRKVRVFVLVGTRKGGFVFESDSARKKWKVNGPLWKGWSIYHMTLDPRGETPTMYAALVSDIWASTLHRSRDLGATWEQTAERPVYAPETGLTFQRVWHVEPGRSSEAPGTIYAGVEPAGLFRSHDYGDSWEPFDGLNQHPSRAEHWFPGAGGLCLHTIILDPSDPQRLYVAISAAGAFRSDDGGVTWKAINTGVRADFMPDKYPEVGQCVHKMVMHPDKPRVLYQQNHCGMYRTTNRGDKWVDMGRKLPSDFGFPIAIHAHDPETIYLVPEEGAEFRATPNGRMAVYRSTDGGRNWETLTRGLPDHAYTAVLREGMTVDSSDPCGVYIGTSQGQVFFSADEGDRWQVLAENLPGVLSVKAVTLV